MMSSVHYCSRCRYYLTFSDAIERHNIACAKNGERSYTLREQWRSLSPSEARERRRQLARKYGRTPQLREAA